MKVKFYCFLVIFMRFQIISHIVGEQHRLMTTAYDDGPPNNCRSIIDAFGVFGVRVFFSFPFFTTPSPALGSSSSCIVNSLFVAAARVRK